MKSSRERAGLRQESLEQDMANSQKQKGTRGKNGQGKVLARERTNGKVCCYNPQRVCLPRWRVTGCRAGRAAARGTHVLRPMFDTLTQALPAAPSQIVAALLFAAALIHSFSTRFFEHLAHTRPRHAGLWHLLGEVEVVFGFWALLLALFLFLNHGQARALAYLESRNFTEPLFVFVIMVVAASRPILELANLLAGALVRQITRGLPVNEGPARYCVILGFIPLLGAFITEPAAMTLAALMLRESLYRHPISPRLQYATLGVLFVNISVGGTLTAFAAPPVLMVAAKWQWDTGFMLTHFGGAATAAVLFNALVVTLLFRQDLSKLPAAQAGEVAARQPVPAGIIATHLAFLVAVVVFAHHPVIFVGLFLFFLGFTHAYARHQSPLILREALLVAFFLGGLVVLGGMQQWWLQPLLLQMNAQTVFIGAAALTAITDNAALTYLGSLVEGLSSEFQIALVAGAVTGGGLTLIANAPNPAGAAILKEHFHENTIHPLALLLAALPPSGVAAVAFWLL